MVRSWRLILRHLSATVEVVANHDARFPTRLRPSSHLHLHLHCWRSLTKTIQNQVRLFYSPQLKTLNNPVAAQQQQQPGNDNESDDNGLLIIRERRQYSSKGVDHTDQAPAAAAKRIGSKTRGNQRPSEDGLYTSGCV